MRVQPSHSLIEIKLRPAGPPRLPVIALNKNGLFPVSRHDTDILRDLRRVAARELEHDPEKWKPVFRKDHAPFKMPEREPIQSKTIPL
jgi:hypothetical protein